MSQKEVLVQIFNDFRLPDTPLALAVDNLNQIRAALPPSALVSHLSTHRYESYQAYGNVFTVTFPTRKTVNMAFFFKNGKSLKLNPATATLSTLVPYKWFAAHSQLLKKYGQISTDPKRIFKGWWIAASKPLVDIAVAEYELWKAIFQVQEVKDKLDSFLNAEEAWEATQREWIMDDYHDVLSSGGDNIAKKLALSGS